MVLWIPPNSSLQIQARFLLLPSGSTLDYRKLYNIIYNDTPHPPPIFMMRIQVNGIVQHTWRATTDAVLTASPVVGLCGGGNKPHLGNHYFDLTNPFVGEEETLIRKAIRCRNAICGNQLGQKFNLAPLRSGDDWTKIRN
jgi:hypothetical protein